MMARSARSKQRPDTLMRDRTAGSTKTSCTARPDHTYGSKCENLGMSKCFPLFRRQRTSRAEVLGKFPLQIPHCEAVSLPAQPHQRAGVDLWEARKCGSGLQA